MLHSIRLFLLGGVRMKKSLNFYTVYYTIIFIATEALALYVALNPTEGDNNMNISEIDSNTIAIVVALLAVCGTIIGGIITSIRDIKSVKFQGNETRSAIKEVKTDTSDAKPKIDNILEHSKETNEIVTRKFEPRLKEFEAVSAKISELHKDMEHKQKINNETSWDLFNKDRFIGGIEKLYEENAKLTNENRNLKVELTDKELKLKSLKAELKVVREENEKLKATQTPTKSYDSMTQDFSL